MKRIAWIDVLNQFHIYIIFFNKRQTIMLHQATVTLSERRFLIDSLIAIFY